MKDVPHIPALRRGTAYKSLDQTTVKDFRTGEVKATVSQVNAGIVRKDLRRLGESRAILKKLKTADLLQICSQAADLFVNGMLPLGSGSQSPEQYIQALSSTSGLPHVLVRRNMKR